MYSFVKPVLCHKYIRRARFSHVQCEQNASITLKECTDRKKYTNDIYIFYSLFISRHYIEFNEKENRRKNKSSEQTIEN